MSNEKRGDGRAVNEGRPVSIERNVNLYAEGSAYIKVGNTEVLCLATVEEKVPPFLRGKGQGWVTAEYAMLPRATSERTRRERKGAGGRTMEIQRLIGRSLRAVVNMPLLGERSLTIDCEVIQADGGTRCASITCAYVAMHDAMRGLVEKGLIASSPITEEVAAVSVGVVGGIPVLDLDYAEDSTADVDMNLVMTGSGKFVEIQGTAEETPFEKSVMDDLVALGVGGIENLVKIQREILGV